MVRSAHSCAWQQKSRFPPRKDEVDVAAGIIAARAAQEAKGGDADDGRSQVPCACARARLWHWRSRVYSTRGTDTQWFQ